ncbi:MAG: hydrogenase iron-sulfur subunit, partial [bacterium]
SNLDGVSYVSMLDNALCAVDGLDNIAKEIAENDIDRVVVGACSPKLYEQKFMDMLEKIGVNPGFLVIANIREHCVYAHRSNPPLANEKAKMYVRLAVEQVKNVHPLALEDVNISKNVLIIGGGYSGMYSAINIAKKGYKVDLLEKTDKLGGSLLNYYRMPPKDDTSSGSLKSVVSEVINDPNITVHFNSTIKKVTGTAGDFKILFEQDGENKSFEAGAIVVAIGSSEYFAREHNVRENPDVISLTEYNQMLIPSGKTNGKIVVPSTNKDPKTIAFVQCNGSLDPKRNSYCSKYCCEMTASSVRQTHHHLPDASITVYYKEVRAFNNVSETYLNDTKTIQNVSYVQGIPEKIDADLVVLANATEPSKDTDLIRKIIVLDKDKNGFFREADFLTKKISTYDPGVFVVGTCSSPKTISERMFDGRIVSDLVSDLFLNNKRINELFISETNEDLCGGCGTCIRTCLFGAIKNEKKEGTNRGIAVVDKNLCRGCGNCVSACPQGARDLVLYPNSMLEKSVDVLSEYKSDEPKILIYACNGCAYPAIDQATRIGYELPKNVYIVRVPCSGRVDTQFLEYALNKGFSGIMIGMCETDSCHYIGGNEDCCKRIDLLIPLLEAKGINKDRIKISPVCFSRGEDFVEAVNDFKNKINSLGGDEQ